jgi:hypothetical protein
MAETVFNLTSAAPRCTLAVAEEGISMAKGAWVVEVMRLQTL